MSLNNQARSLYWWSSAQLAHISTTISAELNQWHQKWRIGNTHSEVLSCVNAHEAGASETGWQPWPHGAVWYQTNNVSTLLSTVFDVLPSQVAHYEASNSIVGAIVEEMWQDWVNSVNRIFLSSTDDINLIQLAPPMCHFMPWSGAIQIKLLWCGIMQTIHISPELVAKRFKNSVTSSRTNVVKNLTPLRDVLNVFNTSIQVELSSIDLDLGALQSLDLDDVLILPALLDEPLAVKTHDGDRLCNAYLGQKDGLCAVELFSNTSSA